ncbi:MAG: sorbosone dehydrogenase family protein [Cupriavidus sp.]|nr:MAG: sorbosone dehydrogenase family protein [Cupriavidus sp.]
MNQAPIHALLLTMLLSANLASANPSYDISTGPNPVLPEPDSSILPTVSVAPAKGWPPGGQPKAAPGLAVKAYARNLIHPRWLYTLPNGDVLVAESDTPSQPEDNKGIKGWIAKKVMKRAGASHESANRITLLRDSNGDGVADVQKVFLTGLNSPIGMALIGNDLYVANTDAILRFTYKPGATSISEAGKKLTDLPGGPLNHHWTKNIIASKDGLHLYATVGSNSNIAENGMDKETNRAAILEIDTATGKSRLFASGLRNPNGMGWEPATGALWTVANERDELGNDLVPDYLTSVKRDAFYGWPYSYYGQHVDERVQPQRPDLVAKAIAPDYALGAHVAALGLTFYQGTLLPSHYFGGAFIGQHGSWNRKPRSGYNVVFVPFRNGKPSGKMEEVLSGFLSADGDAQGRPVGVAIDQTGALLVADDVGNTVWRVAPPGR